jgi:hypothetical protein
LYAHLAVEKRVVVNHLFKLSIVGAENMHFEVVLQLRFLFFD